jgi:hypothetical protein
MMTEAEYSRDYALTRGNVENAIWCFYTNIEIHRFASEDPVIHRAPLAATAMAGLTILLFTPSISNPLSAVAPVGMWAKASIPPLSELAREAGEAEPVGKADRPHIHRPSS